MGRKRTRTYVKVIQGCYYGGYGWEDESCYEFTGDEEHDKKQQQLLIQDLKEYRNSYCGGNYRVITRYI